ncbi:uncharacterized protein PG986_008665 [Apiospora aurea]|uniref:Uncharacterized protein n=1 Tax=Apiospora aurea TaxID=335848 RepID=A0ABR1Q5G8_9PEZI
MKASFIILAASPAAFAAPAIDARQDGGHEVLACACAKESGETYVPSIFLYYAGSYLEIDGQKYCFPAATWSERMDEAFPASGCAEKFPEYPLQACKTARACPTIGDYQTPC